MESINKIGFMVNFCIIIEEKYNKSLQIRQKIFINIKKLLQSAQKNDRLILRVVGNL